MKKALKRTAVVILIVALSIGIGVLYDRLYIKAEKNKYPLSEEYGALIEKYSEEFEVPECMIYAVMLQGSGFSSNAVNEGFIGLMQLDEDDYTMLSGLLGCYKDVGMRYDPTTSIRLGAYKLSRLYNQYETWEDALTYYSPSPKLTDFEKLISSAKKYNDIYFNEIINWRQ